MLIDAESVISQKLKTRSVTEVTFPDGRKTVLTPVNIVPQVNGDENVLSLDGKWRVVKWPFKTREPNLVSTKTRDSNWAELDQPGKVFYADSEEEVWKIPGWDRVGLGHIADEDGAIIRRMVILPKSWKKKRIYLRFDAIYPAGRVYLNGIPLGEHLSGLTPIEFDVTDKVKPGDKTLIAVRILRKHKFVRMDLPRAAMEFAGLAQSAYFHATSQCQIADYMLITQLDKKCRKGTVEGTVCLVNHLETESGTCSLLAALNDPDGRRSASQRKTFRVNAGERKNVRVSLELANPKLWNDEFPNLYTVTIQLRVKQQQDQSVSFRAGFRRLDLTPAGPRLNGNPVKFRGVNHLTYHPVHGMYTPEAWLRRNLTLMKKANVNAIRTHFLGPRCLAGLCDELGIYLLQELPIDWGTHYIHDPEWVGPALIRVEGGIRRDCHHPSVMVWCIGNENMPQDRRVEDDGWNHLRLYEKFAKTLDPSRPTMFPPPGPANKINGVFELRIGDIADTHYSFHPARRFLKTGKVTNPRSWEGDTEETMREEAIRRGWSGVWFSSEYGITNMIPDLLNSPYLSVIDDFEEDLFSGKNTLQVFIDRMRREWGLMREDPTCLGGAYFPWLCSGAGKGKEGNPWGWVRWGEDADWGVVTSDLLPKPFFWALRVVFSPVWFPIRLKWEQGQTHIQFQITNHYNAINLKDCTFRTMLSAGGKWMGQMRKFKDISVSCPPGKKTFIKVPVWDPVVLNALNNGNPALCRCILLDPRGFRPVTADILIFSANMQSKDSPIPIGPDAVLE